MAPKKLRGNCFAILLSISSSNLKVLYSAVKLRIMIIDNLITLFSFQAIIAVSVIIKPLNVLLEVVLMASLIELLLRFSKSQSGSMTLTNIMKLDILIRDIPL